MTWISDWNHTPIKSVKCNVKKVSNYLIKTIKLFPNSAILGNKLKLGLKQLILLLKMAVRQSPLCGSLLYKWLKWLHNIIREIKGNNVISGWNDCTILKGQ